MIQIRAETLICRLKIMQAKNAEAKQRLADAVSNSINGALLPALETYLELFLQEEQVLLLFLNDIKYQRQLLQDSNTRKRIPLCHFLQQQEKIHVELTKVEKMFYHKNKDFTEFISKLPR